MLRLRVAKKLPWVDSKGEVRSPLEGFSLVSKDLLAHLASGSERQWEAWEFGVLTDDWDAPESSKPMGVGDDEGGTPQTCFALGAEGAKEVEEELRPLWISFFDYLLPDAALASFFVADEIWNPRGEWLDISRAINEGLLGNIGLKLETTNTPGTASFVGDRFDLLQLTERWWPSPVGMLAGAVPDSRATTRTLEELTMPQIGNLRTYFEISPTFDNAGFSVLSFDSSWEMIHGELSSRGWADGVPISFDG